MPVPLHVIAGFLGAGKTTALLAQLAARPASERVAVVVNDFGDSALDESAVAERGVRVSEIHGACVCCTAPEDFTRTIGQLLGEVGPDRIFVEPTGLARPADLVDTLVRGPHRGRIALGPVIVLVDPHAFAAAGPAAAEIVAEQAEAADVLVVNRCDVATPVERDRLDAWIAALWPAPLRVIHTQHGVLPADVLDWPHGTGPRARAHQHEHASTDGFAVRSLVWPAEVAFSRARLDEALARASAEVVRIKGLFRTEEGVCRLEVAGGRVHGRPSAHRRDSRADVIATCAGALDLAAEALAGAILGDEERRVDAQCVELVLPDATRRVLDRAAILALPGGISDVSALVPKREGQAARVAALLRAVAAAAGVDVVVVAADGLATAAVPIEALSEAILVHTVNGSPLGVDQGGPYRLLIPADSGPGGACANVKGVVRVVLRHRSETRIT
jgi:G3E family GTPase